MECELKNSAVLKSIAKLYLDDDTADVKFCFKEDVPAHRLILAAGSSVFRSKFYPSTETGSESTESEQPGPSRLRRPSELRVPKEQRRPSSAFHIEESPSDDKDSPETRSTGISSSAVMSFQQPMEQIQLPGECTSDELKEFLQFFYKSDVKLTMKNMKHVCLLAKMYKIMDILNDCADSLQDQLADKDVFWAYQFAVLIDHEALKTFCETRFKTLPKRQFTSDNFKLCEREVLLRILQLKLKGWDDEYNYEVCVSWAKYKCRILGLNENKRENIEAQLGEECLKHVPYPIDVEEDAQAWIDDDAMECDRVIQQRTRRLRTELKTSKTSLSSWFSSNVMLVLGEIRFAIITDKEGRSLPFKGIVDIIEHNEKPKTLTRGARVPFRTTIESDSLKVIPAITIVPGKVYEIRWTPDYLSGTKSIYHDCKFSESVSIGSDVQINFHAEKFGYCKHGLVTKLFFNRK